MKISKTSWHYRLLDKAGHQPYEIRDDLCGYVRQLCVTMFILLPLFALMSPIIFGMVFMERYGSKWFSKAVESVAHRFHVPERKEENESLFRAWLRAKKEKICPLIEFTE